MRRTAEEIHANVGDFVGGVIDPDYTPEISWAERWQITKRLFKLLLSFFRGSNGL